MTRFGSKAMLAGLAMSLTLAAMLAPAPPTRASDHSEAPAADEDRLNDIGDIYAFLDPNDNSKLVVEFTILGFIVPSEQTNQAGFDAHSRYRIGLNEDADPEPDRFIDITFSERTARDQPQMASIVLPDGRTTITAPTTPPSLSATAPMRTITTNDTTGVSFFAGVVDDPFFFDIAGFNRFVSAALAGDTHAADNLQRGRDSFAGYDTLGVALSIPVSLLHPNNNKIGVELVTQRQTKRTFNVKRGQFIYKGPFANVDRMGLPAINTVLIPVADKDKYNFASPKDDANDVFLNDIGGTLTALGTSTENILILKSLAIDNGDYLYVDVTAPNTGDGGGSNAGGGFPNGRRLGDDVVDALVAFVTNFVITTGDNVNGNDVPLTNSFPFFGIAQQPRDAGTIEDNTRN